MSSSVIPATTPVSWTAVPNGSAATPSFAFQNSSSTGIYRVAADSLGISTAGVQRVVVDASGNVGIGTGSPDTKLHVVTSAAGTAARFTDGLNGNMTVRFQAGSLTTFDYGAGNILTFNASATERMRVTAVGNLNVGGTGLTYPVNTEGGLVSARGFGCRAGVYGASTNVFNINWTGSPQLWIDNVNVGTFAFTSDYRIKKNIETQELPALERIAQLRPVKYEFAGYKELFKEDGVQREGFIAHELQAVIPSAVEGEKDAEDQIQSLKLDALCAVMVKAIQELSAKVDAQAAEIEALKAK